jgi:TolB-like protein/class 3 adenylate cyclase/Tfp pilus assembly protein PilF
MTEERRLTAIMFTDVVGFSALAERDERLALHLLDEHHSVVRSVIARHSGREIKTMADGFLIEFASAVDAANCALAMQAEMAKGWPEETSAERVQIRIGIHLGDVVIRGDDILGGGVNIASRIEQLAEPGGICVSEDVARQIRRRVAASLVSMGTPPLKNISEPVEVFRLCVAGADEPPKPTSPAQPADTRSIAVLPFANMSADPENEFFSDGLTEDILTRLSRISSLKVISRTSVMQYKNTTKNMRRIGQELGVANLLEGSVRKVGDRVRITAQLIEAAGDGHLWAESYDRQISDIFAVQSDVADQIARALEATITPSEKQQILRSPTQDMDAYQLYLQGRFLLGKRTEACLQSAIDRFERAIQLDPLYGEAYAGVADCYTLLATFEYLSAREAFPKARSFAEQALAKNPLLAEAHASLGLVKFQHDWDWAEAERELQLAIALNPNYATGHHFYADFLKGLGRFEEAYREIRQAQELDPLSLAISSGVGHVLYLSRQYDRAIEAYRHTLELDPTFLQARLWFGRPLLQKGMYAEAVAELTQAVQLSGASTMSLSVLAHAHAASGNLEEAHRLLAEVQERATRQYVPAYWIGLIYVGMRDNDQAIAWLERAFEERSAWLAWANVEPRFDSLREDPRFANLLRRVGFPT